MICTRNYLRCFFFLLFPASWLLYPPCPTPLLAVFMARGLGKWNSQLRKMAAGIPRIPGNPHRSPGIPGIRAGLDDWKNSEELEPEPRGVAVLFDLSQFRLHKHLLNRFHWPWALQPPMWLPRQRHLIERSLVW